MKRILGVALTLILLIGFTITGTQVSAKVFTSTFPLKQMSAPSVDSPYGITIDDKNGVFVDNAAQDIENAGTTWARVQIPWKNIELTQGQYTWAPLTSAVSIARSHNLLIDFSISNVPDFNYIDKLCKLPTPQATSTLALALVNQINMAGWGDVIKAIEVGNEDWSFVPMGDPASCVNNASKYIPVLEQTSTAIKQGGQLNGHQVQGIPSMLVGTEGFTNYDTASNPNDPHNVNDFWVPFFSDSSDPGKYIDFANVHFYHEGVDPDKPVPPSSKHLNGKDQFSLIWQAIHTAAANHRHPGKPIWVTETGWHINDLGGNGGRDPSSCVTEFNQQLYENHMLIDGRTSGGPNGSGGYNTPIVTHVFFYSMGMYNDGMSLTLATSGTPPEPTLCSPPPLNSCTGVQPSIYYTAAYCMLKNYAATYPTWP